MIIPLINQYDITWRTCDKTFVDQEKKQGKHQTLLSYKMRILLYF